MNPVAALRRAVLIMAMPAALCFGPAAPAQPASTLREADLRIATIAYRLGTAGARFCAASFPLTGLLLHHLPEYDADGRRVQIELHALDRGPGVLATVADSPAARAGLVAGDVLLAVNGTSFPDPRAMAAEKDRDKWRKMVEASEAQLEAQLRRGPAVLRVLHAGREHDATLKPVAGCPVRVRLARSTQFNAFADGSYVIPTTRLLDFTKNDDELAIVLGHELSHNILGHKRRLEDQGVSGGIFRGFGKDASRIRATEEEADRLGLKLAWAAGYDISAATAFWRRFYAAQGIRLPLFRTHPGLQARERFVAEAVAELERQPRTATGSPASQPEAKPPGVKRP
ncbi:MAG: hypothetical protein JWN69_1068 [Alphaproteobacteria bacterium]|nr:hypothetical protein [Alphaproteobacteria bacterium]